MLLKDSMFIDPEEYFFEYVLLDKKNNTYNSKKIIPEVYDEFIKALDAGENYKNNMFEYLFNDPWVEPEPPNKIEMGIVKKDGGRIDLDTEYKYNNDGFRSNNFFKGQDLVVAGCSHTYGIGIKAEHRWGDRLALDIGKENHATIAIPGGSIETIVLNLFKYFREYGNPKQIVCFFPDFYRIRFVNFKKSLLTYKILDSNDKNSINKFVDNIYIPTHQPIYYENQEKKWTFPLSSDQVISPGYAYYINIQYIKMLETYCNASNIDLLWGTWSVGANDLFNDMNMFNNFYYLDFSKERNTRSKDLSCHEKEKLESGKYFNSAQDFGKSSQGTRPHWGAHMHLHIADKWKEVLVERR